jgi:hypothetical protein
MTINSNHQNSKDDDVHVPNQFCTTDLDDFDDEEDDFENFFE